MKRLLPGVFALCVIAAGDAPDPSKQDLERMQGDWAAESMTISGQKLEDADAQALFRTVKGNAYTVFRFRKVSGKGTMKIDATKNPKTIDSTPDGGKVPMVAGIYTLEGDTLTVCNSQPGKPRPTKFVSDAESGTTLTVWKREKK